jgi:hypothetical protein
MWHIHQIIFLGLIVAAFVAACIRAPRQTIGGVLGGFLGVLIPFLCSEIYLWRGGDPTAAGVFSFFCILTLPLGIVIGVIVANLIPVFRRKSDNDKL